MVYFDKDWCEIACFVCGANSPAVFPKFFRGWVGLSIHLKKAHEKDVAGKSTEELLTLCVKRRFDEVDVARLKDGEQPREGDRIEIEQRK